MNTVESLQNTHTKFYHYFKGYILKLIFPIVLSCLIILNTNVFYFLRLHGTPGLLSILPLSEERLICKYETWFGLVHIHQVVWSCVRHKCTYLILHQVFMVDPFLRAGKTDDDTSFNSYTNLICLIFVWTKPLLCVHTSVYACLNKFYLIKHNHFRLMKRSKNEEFIFTS